MGHVYFHNLVQEMSHILKHERKDQNNNLNIFLYNTFCEWNDKICLKLKTLYIFLFVYRNTELVVTRIMSLMKS